MHLINTHFPSFEFLHPVVNRVNVYSPAIESGATYHIF